MGGRWNTYGVKLPCFALLILVLEIQGQTSLNSEGLALLEFRAGVDSDPHGVFASWNPNDSEPCMWSGVHCVGGQVQMLNLNGLSLGGVLAPELGKLIHLRTLVLSQNQFYGAIPKEFGGLGMLEVLDLRDNNLSGAIPVEIGEMQSLKRLLLCNNKFEGSIPFELVKLNLLSELQFDENLNSAFAAGIVCPNRKIGHCSYVDFMILRRLKLRKDSSHGHGNMDDCCNNLPSSYEPHLVQNVQSLVNIVRRKLVEQSSNLAAAPASGGSHPDHIIALPTTRSSGSFPAVPKDKKKQSPPVPSPARPPSPGTGSNPAAKVPYHGKAAVSRSSNTWKIIVGVTSAFFLLVVAAALIFICRTRAASTIGPWRTGLSGQLQKAFVTGVPKLNRTELETACEDFSNIIETRDGFTVYKGTLSSGVEIAVLSTTISSLKDWARRSEMAYRKKIDTLSRVNHKNFVNLLGYCEENEPFIRMMVFEYAPNGNLFEHLHVKEVEHLDWNARTRIIMGTAYCLHYMHNLNPPVAHSDINSNAIYLTDDYAAKVAEQNFWREFIPKSKTPAENESEHSELPPLADAETNAYSFGVLLLEIISGKLPYTEEHGSLVNWAAQYLNDKRSIGYMIDPTLKSFKDNELDVICEVIQACIQHDARKRPTMKEIISRLREVIDISPDAATPRLSPLWWAELEILSAEAA
ncbi:hypothetical protein RJ639_040599 [Escallonia herrerae]|uniref:Protein kinase domain-containing protein n=1 Tax=Escallonia herrerae TaxID=1293975 RepID=A0AA89BCN0_9ASTE|nr:hypothetical protein RJ639_040599 [Escallonia herrerae]